MTTYTKFTEQLVTEVSDAMADVTTLEGIGGSVDEFGQVIFDNVRVICYRVGGEYEIDVVTGTGAFGLDVSVGKITVKNRTASAK